jgi:hypothetical protein
MKFVPELTKWALSSGPETWIATQAIKLRERLYQVMPRFGLRQLVAVT